MKKFRALFFCAALFLIALAVTGCSSGDKEVNKEDDTSTVDSKVDESSSDKDQEDKDKDQAESDEANDSEQDGANDSDQDSSDGEDGTSEESSSDSKDDQSDDKVSQNDDATTSQDDGVDLSAYSAEEIEYARVWQQLGPNQEIDTLYVTKFSKGTPINPNHEDASATYPEDVIMLQGSRVVDGAVTYSGNGDGTINAYKVPARWNDNLGAKVDKKEIKESTEMIAKDTKKVSIKAFANDDTVELIKKVKIN